MTSIYNKTDNTLTKPDGTKVPCSPEAKTLWQDGQGVVEGRDYEVKEVPYDMSGPVLTAVPLSPPVQEDATIEDYKEVLADHDRLVRELDVIINGENAARQASLCDIVSQCKNIFKKPVEVTESPDLPTVEELKRECELRYPDSNNKGTSLWGDRLIIAVQRDAYISGRKKNIARIKELEEKLRQTEEIAQIATGALKEASKEVDGLKAEIEHLQNTIDNLKDERRELRKEINGRLED